MLPQTAIAIQHLIEAGILRNQFKVVTPFSKKQQRYLSTRILLVQPFREVQPYLERLSKRFQVVVYFFDDAPVRCSVRYATKSGLYKFADRQEVPASLEECTQTRLEQLSLF